MRYWTEAERIRRVALVAGPQWDRGEALAQELRVLFGLRGAREQAAVLVVHQFFTCASNE
jgi:hypothetical protein